MRGETDIHIEVDQHSESYMASVNVESNLRNEAYPLDDGPEEFLSRDEESGSESRLQLDAPMDTGRVWRDSVGQSEWHEENEINEQEESEISDWHEDTGEGSEGNWQMNADQRWHQDTEGGEDTTEWHEDQSNATVEIWPYRSPNAIVNDQPSPLRRPFRFSVLDDDSVYSTELRELVGRRSVSNLLRSEFRESLDQLIQSYVQRRGRSPIEWDIEGRFQNPTSALHDQVQGRNGSDINQQEPNIMFPPLPRFPPMSTWQPDMHNWTRRSRHRSMQGDAINDLRVEMARLQHGMSHMQKMLETCMDMQLELQRSLGEEVSAALSRSVGRRAGIKPLEDGSNWTHVRKGTCCICCDSHIDSLLYRCGHMCSCWRCATELIQSDGKCPLCRAPIVDVVRAYSISNHEK